MRSYLIYLSKRLMQFAVVVFVGINVTYLVTHMTPINPVEQSISAATSFGATSPEAIEMMRESLRQLYGLEGTPWRAVRQLLEADCGRGFRALAVRLPDTGLAAHPAGPPLDGRAAPGLDHPDMVPREPSRRPCGILPQQPDPEGIRLAEHGTSSDPVLHRRVRPVDHFRVPMARAADQRRRDHGVGPIQSCRFRPRRGGSLDPARSVPDGRRHRRMVHGNAVPGLECRDRGLRRLC